MNYQELLDRADYNRASKFQAPAKPPNKKISKSGVQSDGVRRFLEKKKAEEDARVAEAKKQREQLLSIRAQNSKNNKKAKIMASRTKDNDFSRIRLTEDEIESKKKIENQIQQKHLSDKVARMKVRIDLEEKEKMLPRKRKRKSKLNGHDEEFHREEQIKEDAKGSRYSRDDEKQSAVRKPQRPPPPPTSYMELLKLAETKMHEPIVIPKKKKEDERLLTKKERKLYEEEIERQRRKLERLERGDSLSSYKPNPTPAKHSSVDKKSAVQEKINGKGPVPAQVTKNSRNGDQTTKFKIPKQSVQSDRKDCLNVEKTKSLSNNSSKTSIAPKPHTNHNREPISKNPIPVEKRQLKLSCREGSRPVAKQPVPEKVLKKKVVKVAPPPPPAPAPVPQLDTAALAAAIAKQVREDLEKQMEEKYAAKFASMLQKSNENAAKPKAPVKPKPSSSEGKMLPPVNGMAKPHSVVPKKDPGKGVVSKPVVKIQKNSGPPPPPAKKAFHINPYLDPPRRRLEPVRPQKLPQKRRIESDDEDDDMSDFIDDGPSQNDEDYSKYIKEIFGYDRNRYLDEDEEDIVETSFAEQMKEETRSAKLGYLEDLEEERKQRELEKKWKQKHKK